MSEYPIKKVYFAGGMEWAGKNGKLWRDQAANLLSEYKVFHPYQGESHILTKYNFNSNQEFSKSKEKDLTRYIKCMKEIILHDISQLATSQIVLALLDASCIGGAAGELTLAVDLLLPVIGIVDYSQLKDIPGWCLACCTKLVDNLNDGVKEVKLYLDKL